MTTVTVTITPVNALRHAREIKELFLAEGRREFPDFFDRAYPSAVANGAISWLGRDAGGRLVMHIACFPRRFKFGSREAVGGLLVNLMVRKPYRSIVPALTLIKQLVQDSKARGVIDFLYADPNAESRVLAQGTGFVRVGTLRRYVLPVRDRRPYLDVGVRLFHALLRATHPARRRARVVSHPAGQFRAEAFWAPNERSQRVAAYHDETLYISRLNGYPGDRDWWFTCHANSGTGPVETALLVRGPDASGLAALHAVRAVREFRPLSFLPDLIAELRRRRCERLQVMTVSESTFGRALRRCGFLPRSDEVPLFALALTPLGEECIRAVRGWEITELDCDR